MGFTLTEVEKRLGLIVGSKRGMLLCRSRLLWTFIDMLGSSRGSSSNAMAQIDSVQTILVSCVTRLNLKEARSLLGEFSEVVYNRMNQVSRLETLKDPQIYTKVFKNYQSLSFGGG